MFKNFPNKWRVMRTGAVLVLALAASWQGIAQSQADAEAALLKYAQVLKSYDTEKMSKFMHPEALTRFRTTIDTALQGSKQGLAVKELLPLFSVTTAADFAQLSDLEVYKRLNDTVAKTSPELLELMSGATCEVVGSFLKDDIAYVTYTLGLTVNGKAMNTQVVQKLKLHDGQWLLMLPSTAEASIAGIEARFK